jgi:hypothetical protein
MTDITKNPMAAIVIITAITTTQYKIKRARYKT